MKNCRKAFRNGRFEELSKSVLSNTAGINALVFTKDGHMIYQHRNKAVLERRDMLCSGYSGSIDDADIRHVCRSTEGSYLSGLETIREGVEELGINEFDEIHRRFLGVTREPLRGGKPEFFFETFINLTKDEVLAYKQVTNEGKVLSIDLGPLGGLESRKHLSPELLSEIFLATLAELATKGDLALAFQTNLILWLRSLCQTYDAADQELLPQIISSSLFEIKFSLAR